MYIYIDLCGLFDFSAMQLSRLTGRMINCNELHYILPNTCAHPVCIIIIFANTGIENILANS